MKLHRAYPETVEWMKPPTSKFSLRCEGEYKDPSTELLEIGGGGRWVMEALAATRLLIAESLRQP